jgi:sRNA-binding regulator protein Hfq
MNIIDIAKLLTIVWIYTMGGIVLAAKITGVNSFVASLIKAATVVVMVYITLILFGHIKI